MAITGAAWVLAAAALAWLAALAAWTLAGTPIIGMFSDSVGYLAIADYYRSLVGGVMPDHAQIAYDTSRFPPLYPALIAAIGGGIHHQDVVIHLSIALTVVAGLAVLLWMRTIGSTVLLTLAALPAIYVTPALADWLLIPLSEPLFLVGLVAALIAAQRSQAGKLDIFVVAALVSLLPLVRSAGIVMVAAFALWTLRANPASLARRLLAIAVASAPAVLWMLYRSTKPVFLDYGSDVSLGRMRQEGGTLIGFAQDQFAAILAAIQSWFGVSGWSPATLVIAVLAAAALQGWWMRIRDWQLDAIFVPLYVGMLLVWPYPLEMARLLGVIMPICAVWACVGTSQWINRTGRAVTAPTAPGILLVSAVSAMLALPAWAAMVERASLPADAALEPYKRTPAFFLAEDNATALTGLETTARILAVIDEATTIVPESECVYATQTALVMAASAGLLRARSTPKIDPDQPLAAQLGQCRYLIVMLLGSRQAHAAPLYPMNEIRSVMQPVLVSRQSGPEGDMIAAALLENRVD